MNVYWAAILPKVLRAYGRKAQAHECRLLNVTENATYLVPACAAGEDALILRLNRPGYRESQQIASELAWMTALREQGVVQTPPTVPDLEGNEMCWIDGQQAIAFEFVDGNEPSPDSWVQCFGELGAITARMHRQAKTWDMPAGFSRPVWDLDSLLGDSSPYGVWTDNTLVKPAQARLLAAAERKLEEELGNYSTHGKRVGLIHSDLRVSNLLLKPDGQVFVIDFDDCGFSWYMFDLACALSFIETEPRVPAMIDAWLGGYVAEQPLSGDDLHIIPTMVMMRRLQMIAWMEKRKETEFAALLREQDFTEGSCEVAEAYLADRLFADTLGADTWLA
jgi:Ser/Thr protein kinase RdoA (MazF antagonist)